MEEDGLCGVTGRHDDFLLVIFGEGSLLSAYTHELTVHVNIG